MGGNEKLFTEANFILMTTKSTTVNEKIVFELSALNSSWYVEQFFFKYKQLYDEKLPLVKIRENKLFRQMPAARQAHHSHPPYCHIYMCEHIFFWMHRAQIIRICNVKMKIWGCTPSSGPFSKWLSRWKCWKPKNRNFLISTSCYRSYL